MFERFHHVIVDRRYRDAEFVMDATIRFSVETVHRKDRDSLLGKLCECIFDQQCRLPCVELLLLPGAARDVAIIEQGKVADPPISPARFVYQQVARNPDQVATRISKFGQASAGGCFQEDLVQEIFRLFLANPVFQIGGQASAFPAIEDFKCPLRAGLTTGRARICRSLEISDPPGNGGLCHAGNEVATACPVRRSNGQANFQVCAAVRGARPLDRLGRRACNGPACMISGEKFSRGHCQHSMPRSCTLDVGN